jgi:RNA polymerase sigma-70 factor (ECF subfamily)
MPARSDQERFLALLEEHKGILYKAAHSYCKNRDDRPDLIQEITVQLWRAFPRFDGRRQFSTWMYRIAMNVAISHFRSKRRRIPGALSIQETGIDVAAADQMIDGSEELRLLYRLIDQLSELDRALMLLYLDRQSHESIAEIMGISATNVGTRIHRIKERWQRELNAAKHPTLQEAKQ